MGNVLVNRESLENIADAIREKTSETLTYTPGEMPDAIRRISGGGSVDDYFYSGADISGGGTQQYGWTALVKNLPRVVLGSGQSNLDSMFKYYNGEELNLSEFGSTVRVTNMTSMFEGCGKLTALDVSGFDTSNVTRMDAMFRYCEQLTALDVSGWDTSRVTNFASMFGGCTRLASIDVSTWVTNSATNMTKMFDGCLALNNDSLNSILLMCSNNTSIAKKTLKNIGLTSAQATICQGLSNYQAFIDAGWTTGY